MRNLNLLKTIVNYVWIMSLIFYPISIIICILLLISNEPIDIPLQISGNNIELNTVNSKIAFVIALFNYGLGIYILYLFKKLLNLFYNKLIFEETCYDLLRQIGKLILYSAFIYLICEFLIKISKDKIGIQFGYGPFIYLIGIGLFFKVLAEVFKVGKRLKEQNELTI
ncbi:DUF2975 domain-containing protein [Flavobacterium sp.]|jgi:hypothetical protein|uniref:DUF2975 domain-containing protein n=1 Tax=Flavobacterium sp. TaxID=239 RepID=UPI0037C13AB1